MGTLSTGLHELVLAFLRFMLHNLVFSLVWHTEWHLGLAPFSHIQVNFSCLYDFQQHGPVRLKLRQHFFKQSRLNLSSTQHYDKLVYVSKDVLALARLQCEL